MKITRESGLCQQTTLILRRLVIISLALGESRSSLARHRRCSLTFKHPTEPSQAGDTAGLGVGDAAHEQNAAAALAAQKEQERSIDVESDGSGRVSPAASVAHADRRRSTGFCAFHVHLDDRHMLDEVDVQIARADARQICRGGEDVGHPHGLEVFLQIDVLGERELWQKHIDLLRCHCSDGVVYCRQVDVVIDVIQPRDIVRPNDEHRNFISYVGQLEDLGIERRDIAVLMRNRAARHRHLTDIDRLHAVGSAEWTV